MPELDYDGGQSTLLYDMKGENDDEGDEPEAINLCSLTSDLSTLAAAASTAMCDPYFSLQAPANHPVTRMINELKDFDMFQPLRLNDNQVSVHGVGARDGVIKKFSLDIARLAGNDFFVRDNRAQTATLYLGNGTQITMGLNNGECQITTAQVQNARVTSPFYVQVGDSRVKVIPSTGQMLRVDANGGVTDLTGPKFWTPPPRPEANLAPKIV